MKRIILASQSPRRRELLAQLFDSFDVVPSNFEEHLDETRPVDEVAIELARGKALDVAAQYPDACVIGADTIVAIDGRQLAKPVDADDAARMLQLLRGRTHVVVTGVVVVVGKQLLTHAETARLTFGNFTDEQIARYVATGDPMDKAGGYGIQSLPPDMVVRVDGDRNSVLGLPTEALRKLLTDCGVL